MALGALARAEPAHAEEILTSALPPVWIAHPSEPFDIMATEVTVAQFRTCIDSGACESEAVDAKCNFGTAGRDDHPINCVTHYGAEQYCTFASAELCSQEQWLAGCRGGEGRAFPYGGVYDLATCNVQSTTVTVEGRARTTMPVGALAGCEGGLAGLYDMAGNVAEWVADCKGTYCKFRGAGYLSNDPIDFFTGCTGVCSGNQKTLQSGTVGFRCCRTRPSP